MFAEIGVIDFVVAGIAVFGLLIFIVKRDSNEIR